MEKLLGLIKVPVAFDGEWLLHLNGMAWHGHPLLERLCFVKRSKHLEARSLLMGLVDTHLTQLTHGPVLLLRCGTLKNL